MLDSMIRLVINGSATNLKYRACFKYLLRFMTPRIKELHYLIVSMRECGCAVVFSSKCGEACRKYHHPAEGVHWHSGAQGVPKTDETRVISSM